MEIHPKKRNLTWVILLGGTLVPVSYLHGILTHPLTRGDIWGGVPDALRPLYSVSMILAALGFFLFTGFILFRVNAEQARVARRFGFEAFTGLYFTILIPSALWMYMPPESADSRPATASLPTRSRLPLIQFSDEARSPEKVRSAT